MSDGKVKTQKADQGRLELDDDAQVRDFAEKHGIAEDVVRDMIKNLGHDRAKLDVAAKQLNAAAGS